MIIALAGMDIKAQDPEFSQFYANPLYLNPALAGANICPRLILNYRNQWPSISNGYVTYSASYDQYSNTLHGGVGAMIYADNAGGGILKTVNASAIYAYRLQASDKLVFNLAVQASFMQRALGWDKLKFEDQIDDQLGFVNATSERPPDNESVMFPDFATGLAFAYGSKLYGGVAAHHLSEPDMAFYNESNNKLPMKITAHAGYNIDFGGGFTESEAELSKFYMSINALYQQQGPFHQINAGIFVTRYPLVIGGWYRANFENPDAFIALVGLTYKNMKMGYSYDFTTSELGMNSGGAHEVSFAWQFDCFENKRRIRAIPSPSF